MRDIFRAVVASFVKSFKDTFDRADNSSIGTSSSGVAWTVYRNTFGISNNKAVAGSSDYSLAAVSTGSSDVEIGLKGIAQGAGASLWVTDAGNWWSVSITQEPEDCNCTNYYNTFTYNTAYNYSYSVSVPGNPYYICYNYYITGYNPSYFTFNSYNPVVAYYCCYGYNAAGNCKGNYYCGTYGGNGQYSYAYYAPGNANYACQSSASGNNGYSYNVSGTAYNTDTGYAGPFQSCETCYPQYIRVFQSVSNVISTATSQLVSGIVQSLGISTASDQITVKAYSDTEMVTQIGSDIVYSATGAVITPRFGISVNPSGYNQGYTISEVTID
jgi:hypothetical protein